MTPAEFEDVVASALQELPADLASKVENVAVVVAVRPTRDQASDGVVLGLYEGVSLADRGVDYFGYMPDRITIFMEPHLAMGLSDTELRAEIRTTVLHEMAHHFGISDDRLDEIGWD